MNPVIVRGPPLIAAAWGVNPEYSPVASGSMSSSNVCEKQLRLRGILIHDEMILNWPNLPSKYEP